MNHLQEVLAPRVGEAKSLVISWVDNFCHRFPVTQSRESRGVLSSVCRPSRGEARP